VPKAKTAHLIVREVDDETREARGETGNLPAAS
jgi:hypothetical protein